MVSRCFFPKIYVDIKNFLNITLPYYNIIGSLYCLKVNVGRYEKNQTFSKLGFSIDLIYFYTQCLKSEQKQEGHHKTEKTHGFGKGESQNGVGEELLFEGWVTGIADDEGAEDGSNTCS